MDLRCVGCGNSSAAEFDISRYESHGEKKCLMCGTMVQEEREKVVFDASPAPFKEGDDTRAGGPITKGVSVLNLDYSKKEGDREWTLPRMNQRGGSKRKKQAESVLKEMSERIAEIETERKQIEIEERKERKEPSDDSDQIERLEELHERDSNLAAEEDELRRDAAPYVKIVNKTLPPSKRSPWKNTNRAKDFLGLGPNQDESDLADEIKELDPEEDWIARIVVIIENSGLPDRAPMDEKGERMWAPRRERIGIEVFASLSAAGEQGFWFFFDYIQRLGLNDERINRILRLGLPLNFRLFSGGSDEQGRGFVSRCSRLMGDEDSEIVVPYWYSNPPEALWRKLALGERGTDTASVLHYWVMRDRIAEIQEQADKIKVRRKKIDLEEEDEMWGRLEGSEGRINLLRAEDVDLADQLEELMEEEIHLQKSGEGKGWVRQYPNPLILSHIPLAYYVAQELRCRRAPGFRVTCHQILEKIAEDLGWCAASVEEMDAWWDSVWGSSVSVHGDDTGSVTELRPKKRHG